MRLDSVHGGTVVRLESGQIVVAAIGPGRGWRYVVQESGVMLETRGAQEVEILGLPWMPHLAVSLIDACKEIGQ